MNRNKRRNNNNNNNNSSHTPPPHKVRVLKRHNGKVTLEVDEAYLNQLLGNMQQFTAPFASELIKQEDELSNNSSPQVSAKSPVSGGMGDVRETQDFRRRIPHFFMGRFKKWVRIQQYNEVYQFLQDLQQHKKSKQGRFELGDFHKSFIIEQSDSVKTQLLKQQIKDLFIDFLQNEAFLQIISYNKITSLEQKTKYIQEIPNLVEELYQEKPFESFLAQENIQKAINKKLQYSQDNVI